MFRVMLSTAPRWFVYSNAALRFGLEVAALIVLGTWGWRTGSGATAYLLTAGAPLLAALLWNRFVAPRAKWFLPLAGRLAIELLVFGSATAALLALGHAAYAVVLAVLATANSILVHLHRDDERMRKGLPLAGS